MMSDYAAHLERILTSNMETSPRGMPTKEVIGSVYRWDLATPLILDETRQLNYRFALGEPAWILSGDNSLSGAMRYLKQWEQFSDDGMTLNGAYGPPFRDQLGYVVDALTRDPFSRQAVMTIWRPRPATSKDIPCTVALQFLLRDGNLDLAVTMRSSDAWRGLPYDLMTFSMMAYTVAALLGDDDGDGTPRLGTGHLFIGSAHLYEPHYDEALRLVMSNKPQDAKHYLDPRRLTARTSRVNRIDSVISELRMLAEEARVKNTDLDHLQTWINRRLG